MKQIAPSILSADFSRLGEEIKAVEKAGADLIHVDIMDGHYVPNITIGPGVVAALRKTTSLPFDVHLMIEEPDRYIDAFVDAGSNIITVHAEAVIHLHRTVNYIRGKGVKAGVSLNPSTPIGSVEEILQDIDLLECTVCPDGCVGGPLEVENRFLPKSRILQLVAAAGERSVVDPKDVSRLYHRNFLSFDHPATPIAAEPLDHDPAKAIRKAARRDRIFAGLPKKDCGVCGAPDCRTLADDIVRGRARLEDCPFVPAPKKRKVKR